jgi:hypothetical protein
MKAMLFVLYGDSPSKTAVALGVCRQPSKTVLMMLL